MAITGAGDLRAVIEYGNYDSVRRFSPERVTTSRQDVLKGRALVFPLEAAEIGLNTQICHD